MLLVSSALVPLVINMSVFVDRLRISSGRDPTGKLLLPEEKSFRNCPFPIRSEVVLLSDRGHEDRGAGQELNLREVFLLGATAEKKPSVASIPSTLKDYEALSQPSAATVQVKPVRIRLFRHNDKYFTSTAAERSLNHSICTSHIAIEYATESRSGEKARQL